MGKRSLLLVDGDARSLRVLEVSLRKAGFLITTAVNGRDALDKARTSRPDLILSDTDMPEMDGFALCRELKADPSLARVPFVFLTGETAIESKIRGLELGVDEYLTKPIYIKEILTRIRILLQKQQRARLETKRDPNTRFAGTLHDMGVVDLIQTIEVSRKSGLIHFSAPDGRQATIYFRHGAVIDAETGHLQGADAVYRLLTWSEGEFELLFRTVRRKDAIDMGTQALLMEGMRRLDEWGRLLEQLPQLAARFEVDVAELAERLAELPDELNHILRLFDGRRSLLDVIDLAGGGDLECIELVSRLYFEGLLHEVEGPPVDSAPEVSTDVALEGWLGRLIPPDDRLPKLDPLPAEAAAEAEAEWDASDADAAAEMMWPSPPAAASPDVPREEAGAVVGSVGGSGSGPVIAAQPGRSAPAVTDAAGRSPRSSSLPPEAAEETARSPRSSSLPHDVTEGAARSPRSSSPPALADDGAGSIVEHDGRRVLIPPPTVGPVPAGSVVAAESAASGDGDGAPGDSGAAVADAPVAGEAGRTIGGGIGLDPGAQADGAPAESLEASAVASSGGQGDALSPALQSADAVAAATQGFDADAGPVPPTPDDGAVLSERADDGSGSPFTDSPASGDSATPIVARSEGTLAGSPGADDEPSRGSGAPAEILEEVEAEFGAITEPFERARRATAERLARREAAERSKRESGQPPVRGRSGDGAKRESSEPPVPGSDDVTRRGPAGRGSNGHSVEASRDGSDGAEFGADTDRLEPDLGERRRSGSGPKIDLGSRLRSGSDVEPTRKVALGVRADDSDDAEFEAETGKFPAELRELVRRRAAGMRDPDATAVTPAPGLSADSQDDAEFEADTQRLPPELRAGGRRRSGGGLSLDVEGDTQQLPRDMRERVRRRTGRGLVTDVIESRMSDLSRDLIGRGAAARRRGLIALEGGRSTASEPDLDESTPVLPDPAAASFDGDFEEMTPDLALHERGLPGRDFGADTEELPTPIEDVDAPADGGSPPIVRVDAVALRSTDELPAPVLGVVARAPRGIGEFPGPVMSGESEQRPTEEFPGALREGEARSPRATGEFPGPVLADGSPRATGEFPGPVLADGSPRATGEFPGPVLADGSPRATGEFPGPVLRVDVEILRSTHDLPGSLLSAVPMGSREAPASRTADEVASARENSAGSLVDLDADEPPTPPSGVLGLGSPRERGEDPEKVVPLGRVAIVRRPSQVDARANEREPDREASSVAPDAQGWSADSRDTTTDATPVPQPPVFGEGSVDLAASSSRTASAEASEGAASGAGSLSDSPSRRPSSEGAASGAGSLSSPATDASLSQPARSDRSSGLASGAGSLSGSAIDASAPQSASGDGSSGSASGAGSLSGSAIDASLSQSASGVDSSAQTESAAASPARPDGPASAQPESLSSARTEIAGASSRRPDSVDGAVEPPGSVVSDPFDVTAGAIAPLDPSVSSASDQSAAANLPAADAAAAGPGATSDDPRAATATPAEPATSGSESPTTPAGTDSPAASQPLPAAAAAAAVFSLAASGGNEVEGILEAEFGTGDVADFDTSDLTPLPNPVPLGDERSNPRIKSSRGAEVAMVSGELAAQPRPASDMDGDVVPLSSRQGDRQNGAGGRAPTARPVVSPVGSSSGTGSLRSVELDQELSAAAEVVDRPTRSAIAVPLPASAEGPAGKLGRARRSPDRSAEVGPPAEDIDTAPMRRPSTRVSAMLRAASGHSLARTVTATIGAAVLVGACFGLLFWWFGARNDSSSADVEAGAQMASSEAPAASGTQASSPPAGSPATAEDTGRTPIASGTGDFAHATAAAVPSSAPVQPTSAPPLAPQPSAASDDDGDQSPPSAALPVAAGSASYDDLYEEAKRARRRRDYHAVLSLTERALAHQETAQALTLQAEAMTALGESRRALPIADRATELRPKFSSGWYIKGRIHRTLGETAEARAAFERYLELDPEGTRADQVIDLLQDM